MLIQRPATVETMLATPAPITVPAVPSREPRNAAVIAANAVAISCDS